MDNTDKLKEIRDKYYKVLYEQEQTDNWVYKLSEVKQIQSQTLEYGKQLGREEVIEEVRKWSERRLKNYIVDDARKNEHLNLWHKLNQLKEQKK
jgi:hypothetical protein